jgi:UDP-GlcNAc:undecaprenyl-phosphate GlcNAc-1-phosphate transferase
MIILAAILVGVWGATVLLTVLVRRWAAGAGVLDHPGHRSSHARPTPRAGGIAIYAGAMLGWTILVSLGQLPADDRYFTAAVAGATLMAAAGFYDDVRSLSPLPKLMLQGLAVMPLLAVGALYPDSGSFLWAAVAAFAIVSYTNMVNFMDGSDGMIAGLTIVNGTLLATIAAMLPSSNVTAATAVVAAAAAGFLMLNRAPASIFMGDVGSQFLGFICAALGIRLIVEGLSAWPVVLVLAPVIVDTTFTIVRRYARGERLTDAHRSHLYQRLLICGWSHGQVAMVYAAWAVLSGVLGLVYVFGSPFWKPWLLGAGCGFAASVLLLVISAERRPVISARRSTSPHEPVS